ncbi:MAG: AmmeMemoRadiSam system protein B [Candidatus Delongbacteria bacterium]|nr:AmmeMemoRadiSam system protein B [Candidatus Delongbacteria bacterium]
MYERKPAVEGSFYPKDPKEVSRMIDSFDSKIELPEEMLTKRPKILIIPHAGLFFSGLTATYAYKLASNFKYDRIVIFAPSHRVYFKGMSCAKYDSYMINGKNMKIDSEFSEQISGIFDLPFIEQAHSEEHSGEIQFPFIYHYFPGIEVSTCVYSEYDPDELSQIIDHILLNYTETLIIISSDLSHFHSYDKCRKIDTVLISGITALDIEKISSGEACGMIGIKAAVDSSRRNNLIPNILDYRNSGDIIRDKSSVVGYVSVSFT